LVLPTVFGWSFAVCPNDSNGTNVIAGTFGNGIYLSTDNGNSWKVVSVDMMGRFIFAMASMPSASGRTNVFAYAVMNAIDQGIYYSTNDGESWNDENPSYHMPIFLSTAVSINKSNSGLVSTNIYAVTYWGVDISTDLDSTWAYKGLRNYTINTLTVVNPDSSKSDMNHLTAGTNEGVFISLDNGDTIWAPFNQGLTNINIAALASDGTYLYAGTTGSGVWKRPLSEIITSVNDKQNDIPKRFTLMQNYPNPFNPSTINNYQLPMNNFVTLKVYDVLGREIKTLVNEYQSAGTHSIAFNATGLPSGVYLYRISAGNYSDTKKLVLIK
jgi:hypothetical protein